MHDYWLRPESGKNQKGLFWESHTLNMANVLLYGAIFSNSAASWVQSTPRI